MIDLHIHTKRSDGVKNPSEVLEIAREEKLDAFAVCDHDNFEAYFEISGLLNDGDPAFIPGVELSAGSGGEDIHILGYLFDTESELFAGTVKEFRDRRNQRAEKMLNKLKTLGIDVPMEMVREIAGDSAIGRPHVAEALVRVGAVNNFAQAFSSYIGYNDPGYVPKENMTPREAIELIHDADGIAVIAHPGICDVIRYIDEFTAYGLDGIEVYHPAHDKAMKKRLKKLADKYSLIMTGGSDYHGREGHWEKIGSQQVPGELFEQLMVKKNNKKN
jgi:predicted metal-dependent phosphoesterase TrpH